MDSRFAAAVVAALVLFGGCSTLVGPGSPGRPATTASATGAPSPSSIPAGSPSATVSATSSVTVAPDGTSRPPVPFTPTATRDLSPLSAMDLPPGVSESAVDLAALVDAHRERLEASAHLARYTVVDGTTSDVSVRVVDDGGALSVRVDAAERSGFLQVYLSPGELGIRNTTTGEVVYGYGPLPSRDFVRASLRTVRRAPLRFVQAARWEPVGVATVEGDRRAVLRSTAVASGGIDAGDGDITDVSGRMVVSGEGRITDLRLRFAVERTDGRRYVRGIDFATVRYGSATVERPDWLSSPPNLRGRVLEGGRLLGFVHATGASIPTGTQVNVTRGFSRIGTMTLDERVDTGETLYVYQTGEGVERELHVAVGERPTLPDNATAFAGTVTVEGWVGEAQFQAAVEVGSG